MVNWKKGQTCKQYYACRFWVSVFNATFLKMLQEQMGEETLISLQRKILIQRNQPFDNFVNISFIKRTTAMGFF